MKNFKPAFIKPKQRPSVTISIRIPLEMQELLSKLAESQGETTNRYIATALDIHLQNEIRAGRIKKPA